MSARVPSALKALTMQDTRFSKYVEDYIEGTPLRVLEIQIKGALGADMASKFSSAVKGPEDTASHLSAELEGSVAEKHGLLGDSSWPAPQLASQAEDLARPGYNTNVAHEYLDVNAVLQAKVKLLAELVKQSKRAVVYAGAGLSTASGIGDYASKSSSILSQSTSQGFVSPYSLKPNLGHVTLAAMARAGLLWRIVNQNHDGLLQKAGVSQTLINEIHGSWFDPCNPVVKMYESLRQDLYDDITEVEQETDLVIVLGSSLAGMSTDRIVHACSDRSLNTRRRDKQFGSVIISLQRTPHDSESSLRIFATIDRVMELLASELSHELSKSAVDQELPTSSLGTNRTDHGDEDVFDVPYDSVGMLIDGPHATRRQWDLREGSKLIVTLGVDHGQEAVILGKHPEGHYKVSVQRNGAPASIRYLGNWWIEAALAGEVPHIPLVTL
jgi:NAD-dependent SIR2 family protein deacetylase